METKEEQLKEEFIAATARWYSFIGNDHHKDRDCHWDIGQVKRYSYGRNENPITDWFVKHEGYVTEFEEIGETQDEVMQKAIDFIDGYIKKHPPLSEV